MELAGDASADALLSEIHAGGDAAAEAAWGLLDATFDFGPDRELSALQNERRLVLLADLADRHSSESLAEKCITKLRTAWSTEVWQANGRQSSYRSKVSDTPLSTPPFGGCHEIDRVVASMLTYSIVLARGRDRGIQQALGELARLRLLSDHPDDQTLLELGPREVVDVPGPWLSRVFEEARLRGATKPLEPLLREVRTKRFCSRLRFQARSLLGELPADVASLIELIASLASAQEYTAAIKGALTSPQAFLDNWEAVAEILDAKLAGEAGRTTAIIRSAIYDTAIEKHWRAEEVITINQKLVEYISKHPMGSEQEARAVALMAGLVSVCRTFEGTHANGIGKQYGFAPGRDYLGDLSEETTQRLVSALRWRSGVGFRRTHSSDAMDARLISAMNRSLTWKCAELCKWADARPSAYWGSSRDPILAMGGPTRMLLERHQHEMAASQDNRDSVVAWVSKLLTAGDIARQVREKSDVPARGLSLSWCLVGLENVVACLFASGSPGLPREANGGLRAFHNEVARKVETSGPASSILTERMKNVTTLLRTGGYLESADQGPTEPKERD